MNTRDAKNKSAGPKLQELCFYFDAVERDRIEAVGRDWRASELLSLRERLLKMPESDFHAAIRTIRSVVEEPADSAASGSPTRRQQAQYLYDESRATAGGGRSGGALEKIKPT